MNKVVTLGEILVEIVAEERGEGFREPIRLVGPFPSGAPAIFIDQVARLGQACGIISAVGDDDFGRVNLERLRRDGVDISAVEVRPGQATGSAFVRYREDGQRDFVYNIRNSACGQLHLTGAGQALLDDCGHFHISGASLFSAQMLETAMDAIRMVKARGGTVSFDPNVRKEVVKDGEARLALRAVLGCCDTFMPSGEELTLLTEATAPEAAVEEILGMGVTAIVVKKGPEGAVYHDADGSVGAPGYRVTELDPTGAGDCFGATFVTCRLQGRSVEESLAYANASGARAVTVRGPMAGTSGWAELDAVRAVAGRAPGRRTWAILPPSVASPMGPGDGVTSVCSAHPMVVEAAMRQAAADGTAVLVEATCNQVNQEGGYTGLTPTAFRDEVYRIADEVGFPRQLVVLGGDHLGPNPWRQLPAELAMARAEEMVRAYVAAGYTKVHLDTSMGCQGEPGHLQGEVTAERAARLARVAEAAALAAGLRPRYVIGTEVPVPGGAVEEIATMEVTRPEAVVATIEQHRQAFAAVGAEAAFEAVVAVVVQPGVEFDDRKVVVYQPGRARALSEVLDRFPGLVYEAHSTDYQPAESLARLVADGFAFLKVGPGLTFALREALYALDKVAGVLDPGWAEHSLAGALEEEMLANPRYWQPYYGGQPDEAVLLHYSYSDRSRYYWSTPRARQAVNGLFALLGQTGIPGPLLSQFLPTLYPRVLSGSVPPEPRAIAVEAVQDVLRTYSLACRARKSELEVP